MSFASAQAGHIQAGQLASERGEARHTAVRVAAVAVCLVLLLGASARAEDPQISALIKQLADENWQTRGRAATALQRLGPRAAPAVPALVEAFRNREHELSSRAALRALILTGAPAVPALIETLGDTSMEVVYWAHIGLIKIGEPAVTPLSEALGHSDWPEALPGALNDESEQAREAALMGISMIDPPAYKTLIQALSNQHVEVRHDAVQVLGQYGAKAAPAVSTLVETLGDENEGVHRAAKRALGQIGSQLKAKGTLQWWVVPLAFKLELIAAFFALAAIVGLVRRVRLRKEQRLFLLLVGSLLPCVAVYHATTQSWVAGFLPDPGVAVVSAPAAAVLSVAFGCVLASVWAWHKKPAESARPEQGPPAAGPA
ncbi:MAG: HEAT repeat domain-containing protein [Planctomycetes bacterium]|nr:HEAT repeat domain-containing protein [Planctomycetota bacterium]